MRRLALIVAPLLGVAGLIAAAAPALSQAPAAPKPARPAAAPAPGGLGASGLPLDISADNSEQFREERRAVWWGNVVATQGTAVLRTPRLTTFFAARDPNAPKPAPGDPAGGVGQVERVEAEGPVYYTTPTQRAKGDHGTYLADGDTITLTGNVVVVQDKNVSNGDKLVIEQKTGHSTLTSNASTSSSTTNHRVRAVLYPNQANQTGPAAPGAATPAPAPAPPKAAGHR